MSRDVRKETQWLKENYKRIEIRVKKEQAEQFIEQLKKENKTVNGWGNEQIQKYLDAHK